jgi:hypothetical protein
MNDGLLLETIRELCSLMGIVSPSTLWAGLRRLRELGWVEWEDGLSRTLRLVPSVPSVDWERLALSALSDLRLLGVDVTLMVGMSPAVIERLDVYDRELTAYS